MKNSAAALYIPLDQLVPGQTRYSSKAVQAKVHKYIKRGDVEWDMSTTSWKGRFERGESIFPLTNALPVIRSQAGFVLMDGHHDVLASLYFDKQLMPITIIDDLSHLELDKFWAIAEQQGWVYLYTIHASNSQQKRVILEHVTRPPRQFSQLVDDPLRYFASITARKFRNATTPVSSSQGAEYPLWIKIGKDIPFIEFALADVLYKNSFVYEYSDGTGDAIPKVLIEQARQILIRNRVAGLRLVAERTRYDKLSLGCYNL